MTGLRFALATGALLIAAPATAEEELSPAHQAALDAAESFAPATRDITMELWKLSETALKEHRSADMLTARLEAEGFTVERGVAGMPTAFVASYGSGSPVIGVLAEYDALEGTANAALPNRQPRSDKLSAGQACGHNAFGAGSVAGAVAIKRAMDAQRLEGTVRLYGTPAEETVVGKVYMAKAGLFDDLDAAIHWHPSDTTEIDKTSSLAMNNFAVTFHGDPAHGAADPWNGRSALDAVEMMNYGVNLMREHVRPETRIHYVITHGGEAPNVVPAKARVWYYVRHPERDLVEDYYARILKIAEGAALATGTTHEVELTTGVHATVLNRPLMEAMQAHLDRLGPLDYSDAEQSFAKTLQKAMGVEPVGYDGKVVALDEIEEGGRGSTDVAEVSMIAPTVGFRLATAPKDIPWHSWGVTASHGTETAADGAVLAAKLIALTAIDMLTDRELLEAAKTAHAENVEEPYRSPIPKDQAPTLPSGAQ